MLEVESTRFSSKALKSAEARRGRERVVPVRLHLTPPDAQQKLPPAPKIWDPETDCFAILS